MTASGDEVYDPDADMPPPIESDFTGIKLTDDNTGEILVVNFPTILEQTDISGHVIPAIPMICDSRSEAELAKIVSDSTSNSKEVEIHYLREDEHGPIRGAEKMNPLKYKHPIGPDRESKVLDVKQSGIYMHWLQCRHDARAARTNMVPLIELLGKWCEMYHLGQS